MDDQYVKDQLLELEPDLYYDVVGHMSKYRMKILLKEAKKQFKLIPALENERKISNLRRRCSIYGEKKACRNERI